MLLETLKALVNSGRDALRHGCGLEVQGESISQLGRGCLTFPAQADLALSGTSLGLVRVGCDALLAAHLAAGDRPETGEAGVESLTEPLLERLLAELPGRRPRGRVTNFAVESLNVQTRGARTFGFRFQTGAGQLFILTEVPSRAEWENNRGSEYMKVMADSYLPAGWSGEDAITGRSPVEDFIVFLRKTEADVQLEMGGSGDDDHLRASFLVEQTRHHGEPVLRFAIDPERDPRRAPLPGKHIRASVGVEDRSLEFELRYLATEPYALGGGGQLPCGVFAPPHEVVVAQRRRAFRIPVRDTIAVEIRGGFEDSLRAYGTLADLSFTGARVAVGREAGASELEQGQRVDCYLQLPAPAGTVEIAGDVRRVATVVADESRTHEEIGIEFHAPVQGSNPAKEAIRRYVLDQQRIWLARRIQVVGVTEW